MDAMPSTGNPRGRKAPPCPATFSKSKSIHEAVVYPQITVTAANNPCLDKSMCFEHVLACGHLVITAKPDEPCAPNCHHASVTGAQCIGMKKRKIETTTAKGQPFYCDACVETKFEALIPEGATAKQAEDLRTELRIKEAKKLGKDLHYRKCYIALKSTKLPCRDNGLPISKYSPRKKHHAFDIATPQVGNNFFEDMLEGENEDEDDAGLEGAKMTRAKKRKRVPETTMAQRKRRKIVVEDDSDDDDDDDFEEC